MADSIYVIEKVEVKSIFDIAIQVVQQGGDSESVQQALNLMADSINLISSTTNIDDVSKRALEAAKPILGTGDLKVVTAALNLIAVIISVNHDKFVNTKDLIQAILNRNEEKLNFVFNTYDVWYKLMSISFHQTKLSNVISLIQRVDYSSDSKPMFNFFILTLRRMGTIFHVFIWCSKINVISINWTCSLISFHL